MVGSGFDLLCGGERVRNTVLGMRILAWKWIGEIGIGLASSVWLLPPCPLAGICMGAFPDRSTKFGATVLSFAAI